MKKLGNPLLSIAAPLLIILGVIGLIFREGSERVYYLPALIVGTGLIISAAIGRGLRRKKLLSAIRSTNQT